jgi:hypothetical protein
MKIQKCVILLFNVVVVLLALASCATPVATMPSKPSATLAATSLLSPILTPTPSRNPVSLPATPTFEPTLPANQEQHIKELLQTGDCKLPCYLSITPGKTTLKGAKAILEGLGASYLGEYSRKIDDGIEYPYVLVVGGQSRMDETPRPDGSIVNVYHHISLITNNDIVQIIEVGTGTAGSGVSTAQALAKFREYWSRYTAKEIFLQTGTPDHLYTGKLDPYENGSSLLVTYEKLGIVAQIYGTEQENNICPKNEAQSISINLSLFNPTTSLLTIYNDGRVPPTDREVWLPVEKVLGVNTTEFYDQVLSNPSVCFKPQAAKP